MYLFADNNVRSVHDRFDVLLAQRVRAIDTALLS